MRLGILKISNRVTPVFQWIQSESNIFLQIKFAHRHDAPGKKDKFYKE